MVDVAPLSFGSLFSGIGGFDLGFERAGMKCLWQVEIDERCQQVLTRHWPDVKRYGDVRDVGKHNLKTVDVICGGFPCQDLSVAGKRQGLAGERSGLWWEFARVIEELRPRWCIIENVPGLLSSGERRDMGILCGKLAQLGYWWAYRVLDAQYFGVAQRRRRVFIIASLTRSGAAQLLFEPESCERDTAPGREEGARVTSSIKASSPSRRNGGSDPIENEFVIDARNATIDEGVTNTLQAKRDGYSLNAMPLVFGGNNTSGSIDVATARNAHGSNRYDFKSETFVIGPLQSHSPEHGHAMTTQQAVEARQVIAFPGMAQAGAGWAPASMPIDENRTGPLDTKRAQCIVNLGIRRLTPTECERLQGFPEVEKCVIIDVCLDHQKNSASVEIRSRKSQRPVGIAERTGQLEVVRYAENDLSTKSQQINKHAQRTVLINCGEKGVEIYSQGKCYLSASFVEAKNPSPPLIQSGDFALLIAGLSSIVQKIITVGKVESQANVELLIVHQNGERLVKLSGSGMMQLVNVARQGLIIDEELLKSIILSPLSIKPIERNLITSFSSVLSAISGHTPSEILNSNSFRLKIQSFFGWTFPQSDSARYRQLGNAVAVPVAEWIGQQLMQTRGMP